MSSIKYFAITAPNGYPGTAEEVNAFIKRELPLGLYDLNEIPFEAENGEPFTVWLCIDNKAAWRIR